MLSSRDEHPSAYFASQARLDDCDERVMRTGWEKDKR
jgi:hypothetical protein